MLQEHGACRRKPPPQSSRQFRSRDFLAKDCRLTHGRRHAAQGIVGPVFAVVDQPYVRSSLHLADLVEQPGVEHLLAQAAVEAFDERVLAGLLPGCNGFGRRPSPRFWMSRFESMPAAGRSCCRNFAPKGQALSCRPPMGLRIGTANQPERLLCCASAHSERPSGRDTGRDLNRRK